MEELDDFGEARDRLIEKPQVPLEEQKTIPQGLPAETATSKVQSNVKSCSPSKSSFPRCTRRRGRRKAGSKRWSRRSSGQLDLTSQYSFFCMFVFFLFVLRSENQDIQKDVNSLHCTSEYVYASYFTVYLLPLSCSIDFKYMQTLLICLDLNLQLLFCDYVFFHFFLVDIFRAVWDICRTSPMLPYPPLPLCLYVQPL